MKAKIETYEALWNFVEVDLTEHKLKDIATLFLAAMLDWPDYNQNKISDFVNEFKDHFGSPVTVEKIVSVSTNKPNAWKDEAGGSVIELLEISTLCFNESDFEIIIRKVINYYESDFKNP